MDQFPSALSIDFSSTRGSERVVNFTEIWQSEMDLTHGSTDLYVRRKVPVLHLRTATVSTASKGTENNYHAFAVTVGIETETSDKHETFHQAITPVLVTAQCFALLPVKGITRRKADGLKFSWLNIRTFYTFVTIVGALVTSVFCILHIIDIGLTFATSSCMIFSFSALMSLLLFLKLAAEWPDLLVEWHRVEVLLSGRCRPPQLKSRFKFLSAGLLFMALVEHLLANLHAMQYALDCACCNPGRFFYAYMVQSNGYVFSRVGYAHWKGALLTVMNIIKTFCWNFTDLFIILVSLGLTDRFAALNQRVNNIYGKAMPPTFWKLLREDYNLLAGLTRRVDVSLNKIVLLSFASNLYFVCYQMLNSLRPLGEFSEAIYFYWSIIYIVLKTCAVSLSTAAINDHSLKPKTCLYAVPAQSYCPEVQRFLYQLTTDHVALTGMNFFSVTRAFVMTVAGTIVTYEVVLMQFNTVADLSANQPPITSNETARCLWFSKVAS